MERIFKFIFPISLILGIALFSFQQTKPIGAVILYFFQPLILLYYIAFFRKKIREEGIQLKFKYPFILSLIVTIIVYSIAFSLKIMHWKGADLLFIVSTFLALITLILAIIYVFLNRQIFNDRLLFELLVFMIPVFIVFMNTWMNRSVNKDQYQEALQENYSGLSAIKIKLNESTSNIESNHIDSLIYLIQEEKEYIIRNSGGYSEEGEVRGGLNKSLPQIRLERSELVQKLFQEATIDDSLKNKLRESETVLNYLISLTEIQNDLLIYKLNNR